MQSLYLPKKYPPDLARKIEHMSPSAISIANRWMLGWPEAVAALIATDEYLAALTHQEAQERRALADLNLNHLSSWEKAEVMGLSQAPPAASR